MAANRPDLPSPGFDMVAFARISGSVMTYDWGKLGSSSAVARLASATPPFKPDESKPYAELWMGTHPNAPAVLVESGAALKDVLTPTNLSPELHSHYAGDLPFLFKVQSIRKALSIQAHPDKALAKRLFEKSPHLYKDPNHKPEMALALTPFETFMGFRPLAEIANHLSKYPEFARVVGADVAAAFCAQVTLSGASPAPEDVASNKKALRTLFEALMTQEPGVIARELDALVARVAGSTDVLDKLVVRLNSQFPQDVGCFCAMLLNFVTLKPGEAIFLAPNEPHAYLDGDLVECMATSDNVVRSGLTPKFKDVETLVSMLTYNYGPADAQVLRGDPWKGLAHSRLYDPPIAEFSVVKIEIGRGDANHVEHNPAIKGPSIAIVTEGSGSISVGANKQAAPAGSIFFIGAGEPATFELGGDAANFVVYRAFCEL
ncbi:Mannose-6-phosphate isomerase [Polyrhizophydium stewartii]|uniref:Mannose-6-phosphate isomerase n=1 Tax=Polyrhizophydium stewartii TaxID=2732419 RepID=A0ABR4N9J8_9FUNG